MIARILFVTAIVATGLASAFSAAVPSAAGAAAPPRSARATGAGQEAVAQAAEVVVPGGMRFIASAAGLRLVAASPEEAARDFLPELTGYLSAPGLVLDYSERVALMVRELRGLQAEAAALDERYPDVVPRLEEAGTPAYEKATALLAYLGFRVMEDTDRIQLQRRVGDREALQRQMLGYLGVSVPLQSRLWAAGEPVVIATEDERVPLLFGVDAWKEQIFDENLDGDELFNALIADPAARQLLTGYAALDRPTREWLFAEVGLGALYDNGNVAAGFARLAPYLRVVDSNLQLPGGDADAWRAIVGPWTGTGDLIARLVRQDGGRGAHLWRALALVPARRASYLLTMGHADATQRSAWAETLYDAIRMPDFARAIRWPSDTAELFVNLRLLPDGSGIDWPGGARVWTAALAGDDRLSTQAALDALQARFANGPDSGPEADAPLLQRILRESEPDREEPAATRKLLAVAEAIRYQPIDAMRDAIPLLVRNYRRFGRAYGFFVMPTQLPAGSARRLVWKMQQIEDIDRDDARIDAIRQMQGSLMLLHRLLLNDLLTNQDRGALIESFLDLPVIAATDAAQGAGGPRLGYGTAVAEWWRNELVPAMTRGLQANGWPGDPADLRSVVVTALVGRVGVAELEVDGIDYNFTPATTRGQRMYTHLVLQQQPSFASLFRLDEIGGSLAGGGEAPDSATLADEIETIVAELRAQMPPNIGDAEVSEALPVTIARDQLFARSETLVASLRSGPPADNQVTAFRQAVNAYLGDALVGIVYALYMGDPSSFTYQQGHIAWLHRLIIAEVGDDGPEDLFSPWAATSESWILDEGSRLHNSLFGAPATLSRWNVEDLIASGGARDPAAAEAWAATLAYIHVPSLAPEAQRVVVQRHELATSWIQEAVDARNPDITPSFWNTLDRTATPPQLSESLRSLLRPDDLQRFIDAVRQGRGGDALGLISDGNRYLLLHGLDDYDRAAPAAARWLVDQMVGMPVSRRGDYLGLMTPPPVPYGEAGDEFADPLLYARLFDIRVRLAVLMQKRGLPAGMHARLLMGTMARVLSTMVPASYQPWRNMIAAIDAEITEATIGQMVVDLAFAEELTPSDPSLALNELADAAGQTGTLGLPADAQQYEAQFGAEVDMITVDIGAWDGDDHFVADLTLDDIVVTRNGNPVTPAFLRLEGNAEPSVFLPDLPDDVVEEVTPASRNFVLVADLLTTSPQDWERILLDVTEFVRAGIGVTDRLALVTIDGRGIPAVTHDFTIDHERIAETLEAQIGNSFATADRETSFTDLSVILCDNGGCSAPGEAGDQALCDPVSTPRFFQCVTQQPEWEDFKFRQAQAQLGRWSIEASLNAERVMSAMTQVGSMLDLGDPFDRQKYVILLSSGFERVPGNIHQQIIREYAGYSPTLNPMEVRTLSTDLSQNIVDLTEIMKRCRCTVYSLGTLGQAAFTEASVQLANTPPVVSRFAARTDLQGPLNALARDTGGKPFFGSDMGIGFEDVLADTRLRYVLGFTMDTPSADAEPQWYELEVRVQRDDVDEVRARDGFWWPRR